MIKTLFAITAIVLVGINPAQARVDVRNPGLLIHDMDAQKPVPLSHFVGEKPVYLKFWASWCVPCMSEMEHMQHTYERYKDKINIISVNIDINETPENIQRIIDKFGLTVPIAKDKGGVLANTFGFQGTPYHVLIDTKGDVIYNTWQADDDLDRTIASLANSSEQDASSSEQEVQSGEIAQNTELNDGIFFFTSTWCDTYFEDSRPAMSESCIQSQKVMNKIHRQYPGIPVHGVITHLWTGKKEVEDYKEKYSITYPLTLDEDGSLFFGSQVNHYPTLVIIKDGEETFRAQNFSYENIVQALSKETR